MRACFISSFRIHTTYKMEFSSQGPSVCGGHSPAGQQRPHPAAHPHPALHLAPRTWALSRCLSGQCPCPSPQPPHCAGAPLRPPLALHLASVGEPSPCHRLPWGPLLFSGCIPRKPTGSRGEGTSCFDSAGPSVCPPPPPGLRALASSRAAPLPAARLPRLVIPQPSPGLRGASRSGYTPLPPPTLGSRPSSGSAGWEPGPAAAGVHGRTLVLPGPLSLTLCPPSSEIEAIRLAELKRKAERRRRATVVVGDLQPLRDALPELLELEAGGRRPPTRR